MIWSKRAFFGCACLLDLFFTRQVVSHVPGLETAISAMTVTRQCTAESQFTAGGTGLVHFLSGSSHEARAQNKFCIRAAAPHKGSLVPLSASDVTVNITPARPSTSSGPIPQSPPFVVSCEADDSMVVVVYEVPDDNITEVRLFGRGDETAWVFCYCDNGVREKDRRYRKRGAHAM